MEKNCVFCEHFNWEDIGYTQYGPETGGQVDGGLGCYKGHYHDKRPFDTEDFRVIVLQAGTCKDYEPPAAPLKP